jgi:hypothetical protein
MQKLVEAGPKVGMLIHYGNTVARIVEMSYGGRIRVMLVDRHSSFGARGNVINWLVTESMFVAGVDDISQRLGMDVEPSVGMRVIYCGFGEFEILGIRSDGHMDIRYSDGSESSLWVDSAMRAIQRYIVSAEDFTFMQRCVDCGELVYTGSAVRSPLDELICENCFADNYTKCDSCGGVISLEDSYPTPSGELYCEQCYDVYYTSCGACGSTIRTSAALYSSSTNRLLCEGCYDEECCSEEEEEEAEEESCACIHSHGYAPRVIFHGGDSNMFYGIELEMECDRSSRRVVAEAIQDPHEQDWHLGEDGSLNSGIELITHARTFESWEAFWPTLEEQALKKARELGCTGHNNRTCGMHIHTSLDAWDSDQLYRLFALVYDKDNYDNLLLVSQRREESLSQWASLRLVDVGKHKRAIKDKLSPFEDRYAALNITETTLEFRLFRSNLRLDRARKNLEFVNALYCYTGSVAQAATWAGLMRWVERHKDQAGNLFRFLVEKGVITEKRKKAGRAKQLIEAF